MATDAAAAGPGAPVPTCPRWTTTDLVRHQGMVHRWAAAHLQGLKGNRPEVIAKEARTSAPEDFDALLGWLADGAAALVAAAEAAPDDLTAMRFLADPPPARQFWARRQAHETTIHRVDALAARSGRVPTVDDIAALDIVPALASDGIDELLTGFLPRGSSRLRLDRAAVLSVRPDDAPLRWTVHVSAGPPVTRRWSATDPPETPDAVVSGSSVGLYVGLWNRGGDLAYSGGAASEVASAWRRAVRVRWS